MSNVIPKDSMQTQEKSSEVILSGRDNVGIAKELIEELGSASEQISLGQVTLEGKSLEVTLRISNLLHKPRPYFLEVDGKNVDYYSKQENREILEGGNGVYAKDDIDIEGNTIYMRDGNRRWLKYSIERKRNDKIGLVLQERTLYNPLKSSTKTRTIGRRKNMTLIEYCNPPERGNIDENKFGPTEGKLLLIHNRNAPGRDKIINFPQKEGVIFDENTAETYNYYEFYISDTSGKRYKYDINVVNSNLREMDNI